ncbi:MAG: insulinase family protein [Deltaproteobacteria bacterium]|nr:insulinase family protein [Deltaproteobacteria bacterium]
MATHVAVPPLAWSGTDESYVLDNGLKVILAPQPGNPVISVRVTVKAGSADEKGPKEYGLAHLMEHMAFKGTAKRKVGEISRLVESNGGSINAYTYFDETCYYLSLPAEQIDLALDILADLVFAPTYDPHEYALEKEVVVEEIKRAADSPERLLADAYFSKAFAGHPYGHMVLGSIDSVRGASRDTAFSFFKKFYRPDNAFLAISGGLDLEIAKNLVAKYFGPLKKPKVALPAPLPAKPPTATGPSLEILVSDKVTVPKIILGFPAPSALDASSLRLDMLAAILSNGRASRLYSRLKMSQGLVTDIDASALTLKYGGNFFVSMETELDKIEPALEATLKELIGLVANPPTFEEMTRARALTGKSFLLGQESAEGQNGLLASFELLQGDYRLKDAYLTRWARLTSDDLTFLAREIFQPNKMNVALIVPADAPRLDQASLTKLLSSWSIPASLSAAKADDKYEIHRLANGLEVMLLRDSSLPQVIVKAVSLGGLLGEGPDEDGLSNLFSEVWPKASQKLDAKAMALALEDLGAGVEGFSARNSLGLSGSFLTANWQAGFDLFLDLLTDPALDESSLAEVREETLAAIKAQDEHMAERVFRLLRRGLFGSHPYSRNNLGLAETVAKCSTQDLRAFYQRLIRPESLLLTVAGDIDQQAVLAILTQRLGSWTQGGQGLAVVAPPAPEPLKATGYGLDKVDRAQTHLAVGYLTPGLDDPDQAPLDVLNAYLSGMGGVLFRELRDKQSLAYLVTSGFNPGLKTGVFYFYIATDPQKTSQALEGILGVVERLKVQPIAEEELTGAKRFIAGVKKISLQTLSRRVDESVFNKLLGLGLDFDQKYLQAIMDVTPADVRRVAQKYLRVEEAFLGAAGQGEPAEKAFAVVKDQKEAPKATAN